MITFDATKLKVLNVNFEDRAPVLFDNDGGTIRFFIGTKEIAKGEIKDNKLSEEILISLKIVCELYGLNFDDSVENLLNGKSITA